MIKASVLTIHDSTRIKLETAVTFDLSDSVKRIPGADWSWSYKSWHFPCTGRSVLLLTRYFPGIEFDKSITEILNQGTTADDRKSSNYHKKVVVTKAVIREEKYLVINPDNDEELIALIEKLPGVIADSQVEGWIIPNRKENLRSIFQIFKGRAWVNADAVFENGTLAEVFYGKPGKPTRLNLPELNAENQLRLEKFSSWLKSSRYSDSTLRTYTDSLRIFFRYLNNKAPENITNDDLIEFNNKYILENRLSASFQNQVINAIKLYFRKIEHRHLEIEDIHRPRREKKLPNVLSQKEIQKILQAASTNLKHKAMLSLIYSCGLRRNELLNLVPKNVDSNRGLLIVRNAKGKKDRVVPLSEKTVELLRAYYTVYQPLQFLFEGWRKGEKYSERSIEEVLKKYTKLACIDKPVTLHWLRHSYATHLLEKGTDLRYIQEILGHKSSKTTEIYTHVSTRNIQQIKSPFDDLEFNE